MSHDLLPWLLLLSFPLLAGLGGVGWLVANADRRQRSVALRVAHVLPRGQRAPALGPIAREAPAATAPLVRAALLFGCDPRRGQNYPVRWWLVLLGTGALGRVAAELALPLLGLAGWLLWPATWVLLSRSLFSRWEAQRRRLLLAQFPDALTSIVRSVRVGIPVGEAIRQVGHEAEEPTASEFRQLAGELAIGVPMEVALRGMSQRTGLPDYRFFGTTIALQAQTGGTLGEALENLADIVRRRISLRARGYALTSEARASAMVLCAMPVFVAGMMYLLTPDYMTVLLTTDTGQKMLGIAAISMSIGVAVMRALIGRVLD